MRTTVDRLRSYLRDVLPVVASYLGTGWVARKSSLDGPHGLRLSCHLRPYDPGRLVVRRLGELGAPCPEIEVAVTAAPQTVASAIQAMLLEDAPSSDPFERDGLAVTSSVDLTAASNLTAASCDRAGSGRALGEAR